MLFSLASLLSQTHEQLQLTLDQINTLFIPNTLALMFLVWES